MRRHYVVSYDISDDRRRNQVFKHLLGAGDHVQFSVFFCELSDTELVQLRVKLRKAINEKDDQIMIVDLGHARRPLETGLDVLGKAYTPSTRTLVV